MARRADDAALNRQRRAFLLDWLRNQPVETLMAWIDGLWLGQATEAQLAALVHAVEASATPPSPTRPRPRGRPRRHLSPRLPAAWRAATADLAAFSRARGRYHGRMNRTRRGGFRSSEARDKCLASPIGQRVDRAGLFEALFDEPMLGPQEMAARLLHRELQMHLSRRRRDARRDAALRPPADRRLQLARADAIAAALKTLPTWRTLLNQLRASRPSRRRPGQLRD
jgi:hypothetical protein